MVPGSFGCGSAVLATSAMLAPSEATRLAIASPIPRLAPEMNIVFPASDMGFTLERGDLGGDRVGQSNQLPGIQCDVEAPLAGAAQHLIPTQCRGVHHGRQ